ncbi:glucose PTS transporter transcription antiterminator GlcT [Staphylococcus sp. 11261D007BR]
MKEYKITKILNNNVIICEPHHAEVVVIGKGLGFNKKAGMTLHNPETIEKVFTLENKVEQDHYKQLVAQTDEHVLRAVIDSVQMILTHVGLNGNESFIVALTDHLIFAIKRLKNNQFIPNPFLSETQFSYPDAYKIAKRVVNRINNVLNISFPEDEVGFITLHISSFLNNHTIKDTQKVPELIQKLIQLIEHDFNIHVSTESIQYQRFIRHIHFLLERLKKDEHTTMDVNFETLLKAQYPICYNVAVKGSKVIQSLFNIALTNAEVAYLTLHIYHLVLVSQKLT